MAVSSETSLHSVFVVCFQRMGWADHVESTGEMRNAQKFLIGNRPLKKTIRR